MEFDIKKVRILLFVSIALVCLEIFMGIGFVFSGLMYRSFEKDKAKLTLSLLKINNTERYEKIMVEQDSLAKVEFYGKFQKRKKPILVTSGYLYLLFAILHAIPSGLLIFLILVKKGDGVTEEVTEEPKTEAKEEGGGEKGGGGGGEVEF